MAQSRLRIFYGPQEDSREVAFQQMAHGPKRVTVPLSEIFPLLADAVETEKTWLKDFGEDEITISSDLYDVLMAYEHYRRPSA